MIGATYKLTPNLTFYGDFAVANRRRLLGIGLLRSDCGPA